MKNSFKIIAASLLGAGLIHFTLTACSGGSSDRASSNPASSSMTTGGMTMGGMTMGGMTMDPTKDAAASPGPTCAQWQLYLPRIAPYANKFLSAAGTIDEGPDSPPGGVTYYSVPPGWEPFAADQNGSPIFRRCAM